MPAEHEPLPPPPIDAIVYNRPTAANTGDHVKPFVRQSDRTLPGDSPP
jgi:hypothetical protein